MSKNTKAVLLAISVICAVLLVTFPIFIWKYRSQREGRENTNLTDENQMTEDNISVENRKQAKPEIGAPPLDSNETIRSELGTSALEDGKEAKPVDDKTAVGASEDGQHITSDIGLHALENGNQKKAEIDSLDKESGKQVKPETGSSYFSPWESLPPELFPYIFNNLEISALQALSYTNKTMLEAITFETKLRSSPEFTAKFIKYWMFSWTQPMCLDHLVPPELWDSYLITLLLREFGQHDSKKFMDVNVDSYGLIYSRILHEPYTWSFSAKRLGNLILRKDSFSSQSVQDSTIKEIGSCNDLTLSDQLVNYIIRANLHNLHRVSFADALSNSGEFSTEEVKTILTLLSEEYRSIVADINFNLDDRLWLMETTGIDMFSCMHRDDFFADMVLRFGFGLGRFPEFADKFKNYLANDEHNPVRSKYLLNFINDPIQGLYYALSQGKFANARLCIENRILARNSNLFDNNLNLFDNKKFIHVLIDLYRRHLPWRHLSVPFLAAYQRHPEFVNEYYKNMKDEYSKSSVLSMFYSKLTNEYYQDEIFIKEIPGQQFTQDYLEWLARRDYSNVGWRQYLALFGKVADASIDDYFKHEFRIEHLFVAAVDFKELGWSVETKEKFFQCLQSRLKAESPCNIVPRDLKDLGLRIVDKVINGSKDQNELTNDLLEDIYHDDDVALYNVVNYVATGDLLWQVLEFCCSRVEQGKFWDPSLSNILNGQGRFAGMSIELREKVLSWISSVQQNLGLDFVHLNIVPMTDYAIVKGWQYLKIKLAAQHIVVIRNL